MSSRIEDWMELKLSSPPVTRNSCKKIVTVRELTELFCVVLRSTLICMHIRTSDCWYQCSPLPGKTCLHNNDLLCAEWDVKLWSLTQSLNCKLSNQHWHRHWLLTVQCHLIFHRSHCTSHKINNFFREIYAVYRLAHELIYSRLWFTSTVPMKS